MNIKFLGYGGAFEPQLGNSSAIVNLEGKNILIDCGFTVYPILCSLQMEMKIDYILITHLHNDHTGSLATYLMHYHMKTGYKMKILVPRPDFKKDIKKYLAFPLQKPNKYIEFVSISDITGVDFIDTYGKHVSHYQTFAYIFRNERDIIVYSGDNGDADFLFQKLKDRGVTKALIFHDIFFNEKQPSHAFYKTLEKQSGNFQIIGYHNNPSQKPADCKIPFVSEMPEYLWNVNFNIAIPA